MIEANSLFKVLIDNKVNFFTGVPDSVLKNFTYILDSHKKKIRHIITANEGGAVALAAGNYLATKNPALVYMQNSGLGNAINPLISICHSKVYSIPLILIIGWRGSPKEKDEVQHQLKGKITPSILKLLNIKFLVLNDLKDLKKMAHQHKAVLVTTEKDWVRLDKKDQKDILAVPLILKWKDWAIMEKVLKRKISKS